MMINGWESNITTNNNVTKGIVTGLQIQIDTDPVGKKFKTNQSMEFRNGNWK